MDDDIKTAMNDVHLMLDEAGMPTMLKLEAMKDIYQLLFMRPNASVAEKIAIIRQEATTIATKFMLIGKEEEDGTD